MKLGSKAKRHPCLEKAHLDMGVGTVARAVLAAADAQLLDYALYSVQPGTTESLLQVKRRRLGTGLRAAVATIDPVTTSWRATLGEADLLCRKGAIVERMAFLMLSTRHLRANVWE
jgi:hypothetical protein